jgi:hypothetical protein
MLLNWFNIHCRHKTPSSYYRTDFPTSLQFPYLGLLSVISIKASGAKYKPRQSSCIICCRPPLLSCSSSVPSVYTLAMVWDTKFHTYTKQAQLNEGLYKSSETHPRYRERPEMQLSVTRWRRSTAILLIQSSEFRSHRTFFLDGYL